MDNHKELERKIRIAFFGEAAFPSHNIKWINHLVNNFPIEAILITYTDENSEHIDSKVKVYNVLRLFPVLDKRRRKELVKQYRDILLGHEVDLLHFLWGVDVVQWATVLNTKYIITTRGSDVLRVIPSTLSDISFRLSAKYLYSIQKRARHKRAYRNSDWVTSTSESQKRSVRKFQPAVKQHSLVRTGTYSEFFHKTDLGRINGVRVILSPRTMRELYNQDIIVKAFAKYFFEFPTAELRMVDNHPGSTWSDYIQGLVCDLGISEHVVFLTDLDQGQMAKEYKDADVCVMIPKTDGVPVSGIESMMAGCPIILGDNQYDKDIFNENTVWQLKENQPDQLFQALLELNNCDPEVLKTKVLNAQRVSLEYGSTEREMEKVYNIYRKVLSEN